MNQKPLLIPGFRPTLIQKFLAWYLPKLKKKIDGKINLYRALANVGIEQHSCWAGGFDVNRGVVPQPCETCYPFSKALKASYKEDWLKIPPSIKLSKMTDWIRKHRRS